MSRNYKINNPNGVYFVTFTVVQWIDFFTRDAYRQILLDSLKYCQQNKGLEVYAWVIMTNHVHLIIGSSGSQPLNEIVRDMKSFTSHQFRKRLEEENTESRRKWMYWIMQRMGIRNKHNKDFQFWQQHYHPVELNTQQKADERLNYIHQNPVRAGFVSKPEDWLWSSAADYAGKEGMLELVHLR